MSFVVSIKLSQKEYFLWDSFKNYKNLSFAEFINTAVENYIHFLKPNKNISESEQDFILQLQASFNKLSIKGKKKTLTFRVQKDILKSWDKYCEIRFITRTSLIKQSIYSYFNPKIENNLKLNDSIIQDLLLKILNNVILKVGIIDFREITSIFQGLSSNLITDMLNYLESKGFIARKGGGDVYVPANPEPTKINLQVFNNNFTRILENMEENPNQIERQIHKPLFDSFIGYISLLYRKIKIINKTKNKNKNKNNRKDLWNLDFAFKNISKMMDTENWW